MAHSVHPSFCRDGLSLQPNFQKGGHDKTSTFRGGCWERWGDFFQGAGWNFHITNKVKSEIFNDKKVFKQKYFFSFINKNSNWEFLPKNFVTVNR